MTQLARRLVRLMGPTRIEQLQKAQKQSAESDAFEVPPFRSRRTVALLGYLAAEQRPISRDYLAGLFWPDAESGVGRGNLRRELYNLAQILPECWDLDRQAVSFVPSEDTEVDLYILKELQADHRWEEAVSLLSGEFLEGVHVGGSLEFENWLLAERERWRRRAEEVLSRVIEGQTRRGRYSEALRHTRRLLQLAPWNEDAHRQSMRLLAWTGQRGAALRQFEQCKLALWEELRVEPAKETIALYEQVYSGELAAPPQLPAFLVAEGARHAVDPPSFVGRDREMAQLDAHLQETIAGKGRVMCVTGGAGRGKTALMEAFARRAMEAHPELLVASGHCNAYSGAGDPYLPFRDVMAMLTGDVEARWDAGAITRDHARRLWAALPLVVQSLLDEGPHLLDVLVPGAALLSRAKLGEPATASSLPHLRELVNHKEGHSRKIEQPFLFQQTTDVLRGVAQEQPVLLLLDDLQWADTASAGLLFHLGRRLAVSSSRVMIVCAYRPEEVALVGSDRRHPLAKAVSEFKRAFGDIWIRLGPVEGREGREFVNALVDKERNRLGDEFRAALFRRTRGHPLFTVELLRAMQERGDLRQDENGRWITGPRLDWEVLPARVEAVIEERIDRLDPQGQEALAVASVEGEIFTAQVIAEVQQMAERPVLRWLSAELERRHRLVREQEEVQTDRGRLSRYRFGHVLFQEYVYKRLSPGERRILHGDVGRALEKLYEGRLEEMAVQLGHHFREAGAYRRAVPYFTMAARRAARIHANDEAITHYTSAIEFAEAVSLDALSLAKLYQGRGLARETLGEFDGARADLEAALKLAHTLDRQHLEWRLLLDLGKVWAAHNYRRTRDYFERALELSRHMNDPAALGGSLNWMGNWFANAEDPARAAQHHEEALELFEELGDKRGLASTLDLLGIANLLRGNLSASVGYYDRAIVHWRDLDDRPRLASSLIGRGTIVSLSILLTTAPAIKPPDARNDFEEAILIARELHSPQEEAWASWSLGLLNTVYGQYGRALEVMQSGLRIAYEIGHGEWEVGNRFALGVLYAELLAPNEARRQLEGAQARARGLRSQYWINHVCGALAAAHILLGDSSEAQICLDAVISPETAMDTMGKRYCWARRAELALLQGDPALALEITDRLIASAPGMPDEGVITFLWMLKGQAMTALGRGQEADSVLRAAIENAQALKERFLLWRAHASLGQLYARMDRQTEARKELSTARDLVQDLAAAVPDKAFQDNFLQRATSALSLRED